MPKPANLQQHKLNTFTIKPLLRAVPMALFPTMGSLQDVIDLAESRLPISTKNDVITLLGTYHNTLLKQLSIH